VWLLALVLVVTLAGAATWYGRSYLREQAALEQSRSLRVLLDAAREDLEAGRLTAPPGSSALDRYRDAARQYPQDSEVQQGIRTVAVRVVDTARQALADGDRGGAEALLNEAATIWPEVPNLGTVRDELARRRAEEHARRQRIAASESDLQAALAENDVRAAAVALDAIARDEVDADRVMAARQQVLERLDGLLASITADVERALKAKDAGTARAALDRAKELRRMREQLATQ